MKSPFPGLDPYLERKWSDVHQRLTLYTCNALQAGLPEDLIARTEERVYIERENTLRPIIPDIAILESPDPWLPRPESAAGSLAVAEPLLVVEGEPVTESFVEIRVGDDGPLVTVIEFLSPANKLPGEGRRLYQQKQQDLRDGGVHLVEIDLVRAGARVFDFPRTISSRHHADSMACIRQGQCHYALYAFPPDAPLPPLPIPLRWDETPVVLNLQAIHDQSYQDGRYNRTDYTRPPVPPLAPEVEAWADALLRAAGRR